MDCSPDAAYNRFSVTTSTNEAGLCTECRNVRIIRSDRGSVFYLCQLAAADPRFPKYPSLPVRDCPGFQPAAVEPPYPSRAYAWYVVAVLAAILMFSFIDRQIMNLLVAPIRRDLDISDTGISLLIGFAFAIFYTLFGIPLGRLADHHNRRNIIAGGLVSWSLFTAGCGLARNYWQLLLTRIGVGVGEASLSPSAYSLISDYFPPERRATALSVYGMGIYVGAGVASLLGAAAIRMVDSWRTIFFLVGLPGAAFATILFTIREPVRRGASRQHTPLKEVFACFKANRSTFLCHNLGVSLIAFSAYGAAAWQPSYFIRTHHWTASEAGFVLGIVYALAGSAGVVAGGRLADYLRARGHRDANMRVMRLAGMCAIPSCFIYILASDTRVTVPFLAAVVFAQALPYGVAPAAITQIVPNAMRGQATATYLFVNNLIGLGLGPTAMALMTDYVFRDDSQVRYSILSVTVLACAASSLILHRGLGHFRTSLKGQGL